mgnify:CR=1 FL=1|tara:strand:+ start:451 stop:807 length:357 start_codon:yes stop_codon:yes gene_type:complete
MGILSSIFGTGDVIGKGIDLIDSIHTSDTELIEAKTKAKTDIMSAYAPFKLAQRVLATMFAVTYIGSYLMILVMVFMDKDTTAITGVMSQFEISWIMLTIIAFYFGGGFAESVKKKLK